MIALTKEHKVVILQKFPPNWKIWGALSMHYWRSFFQLGIVWSWDKRQPYASFYLENQDLGR